MLRQRRTRKPDPRHLDAIRALPCLICHAQAEPAHIRMGAPEYDKLLTGIGQRPDDAWVVPLCPHHHRSGPNAQHARGERIWWNTVGVDPCAIAKELYRLSPDIPKMREYVLSLMF